MTLLAWLFLTSQGFELRSEFCALVLIQPEEAFLWSLTVGFGAKTPARVTASLPSGSLESLVTL